MEANINLSNGKNYAKVTIIDDDLSEQVKTISIDSLRDIFHKEKNHTYFCPCPFFNAYETSAKRPGLLYGLESEDTAQGLFFLPAAQRYLNFAGEKKILPYPSVLFYLFESKGILRVSKCFSLKVRHLNRLRMNSVLYAFPFGNVHPVSGSICWGSNLTTGINGFDGLAQAVESFFYSESNMDYVQNDSFKGYSSYENLLKFLNTQETFPSKALVQSSYCHTVGELLEYHFKKEESYE